MDIHEKIKELRTQKRYSQYDMAELLGIGQSTYLQIEKGNTELTVSRLYKIAEVLGVSAKELLFDERQDNFEEMQSLKNRIAELEATIKDKEQINTYLTEKQAVCEEYLNEILENLFEKIAIDDNSFGTIVYKKNGVEEKVSHKDLEENQRTQEELEEIHLNGFIRYEFTDEELDKAMKILFTNDEYKVITDLIMWTGMITDKKFVNGFKKYTVLHNLTTNHMRRLYLSKHNPLGFKNYNSQHGITFD